MAHQARLRSGKKERKLMAWIALCASLMTSSEFRFSTSASASIRYWDWFSFYLMGVAIQYRLPKIIILRMAMNVAFDYLVGIVPFIGDASDFFIKSNRWNLNLLRRYAQERGRPSFTDYLFVIVVIGALVSLIAAGVALAFYSLRAIGRLW
jgi:hypothetical protein